MQAGERRTPLAGADGFYAGDIEFLSAYVHRLSPAVACYVSRFRGARQATVEPRFRYCELACGDGSTTNALAGMYPDASFVGVDFNGDHIDAAEAFAAESGLSNVRYVRCSFDRLEDRELPSFDYIAINGAYGWLAPDLREAVRRFVGRRLVDGGFFTVEYISLPGKAAVQTMWRAIQRLVPARDYESGADRGTAGIRLLNAFNAANPAVFRAHPSVRNACQRYLGPARANSDRLHNFVHNVLAGGFEARYFSDVYDEMAAQGLAYVGRVDSLAQNDEFLAMGPARYRLIGQFESPRERELIKDFLFNSETRCDLYIKSARQPPVETGLEAIGSYYALSTVATEQLSARPYRELFSDDDLSRVAGLDGSMPLAECLGTERTREAISLLNRLVDSGEIQLSETPWREAREDFDALAVAGGCFKAHLDRLFRDGRQGSLPVAGLVTSLKLGPVEVGLLVLLLEYGKRAALDLLESRVGQGVETFPEPYAGSVLCRRKPRSLFEQATDFYDGRALRLLLRMGVLVPA